MRVLLIEDDPDLGEGIRTSLREEGYTLDWLKDGESAVHALREEGFDLVVLDLGLPRLDGIQVLRQSRANGLTTPVLILTARDDTEDRVAGLDAGADDYLVKPFDIKELKARLRALLRRRNGPSQIQLEGGGIALDPATRRVTFDGQPVNLTPREYQLLHELLANPGKIFSRDRLMGLLYGWDEGVESNTLEVHIYNLRKKLRADLIRTVRGIGYRLECP
ncbi:MULTISPECIES: response regulator transcription factor [Pseudomonadaceae]|jgi:two-component system response regulator QseB|uniref:Two-component system, OmpR family, response regulator QseB n=3 Tax=Pseudomonadaceae TaxID=135621 RepID=A0A1G5NTA3_9PSED|nr:MULTISPECIES: response regulator transcription factor [Pseudomonas]KIZ49389.1 XRE family transcriptional regulator [Pseudomonas oryzihabitans]KTT53697.1 XRE family transcriptional regulator [Pseudomonas psychrotolerans]MBA1260709.1 response regulator transcription factor [Pseudomonas psychrotolerans]MBH3331678.1 response regulator transcription factor [Pseudomonas oryzihabitans]MCI1008585.1 response regulator transcription factor [Pseudomonas oryzihabitans]